MLYAPIEIAGTSPTRDSSPVIAPAIGAFYKYFGVVWRPCKACKWLAVLLIGVFITPRSAVRSCPPPPFDLAQFSGSHSYVRPCRRVKKSQEASYASVCFSRSSERLCFSWLQRLR